MIDTSKFRPRSKTSDAIKAAIALAHTAEGEVKAQDQAALEQRDALLIDGSAKERAQAQARLVDARDDLEALAAIEKQLSARLDQAIRDEAVSAVHEQVSQIGALHERANSFWQSRGPELLKLIGESNEIADGLYQARRMLQIKQARAFQRAIDDPRINQHPAIVSLDDQVAAEWRTAIREARVPE